MKTKGFGGTHITLALVQVGFDLVLLDNKFNTTTESLRRVKQFDRFALVFNEVDILDRALFDKLLIKHPIPDFSMT
jgi:UDP-glucose 4-epimerase